MLAHTFLNITNGILTIFALYSSLAVLFYTLKSLHLAKKGQKIIAWSLVCVGLVFSTFAIASAILYLSLLLGTTLRPHIVSGIRSVLVNVLIILTSKVLLDIFKNKV